MLGEVSELISKHWGVYWFAKEINAAVNQKNRVLFISHINLGNNRYLWTEKCFLTSWCFSSNLWDIWHSSPNNHYYFLEQILMIIYIKFPFPDVNLTLWMLCLVQIFFLLYRNRLYSLFPDKRGKSSNKGKNCRRKWDLKWFCQEIQEKWRLIWKCFLLQISKVNRY